MVFQLSPNHRRVNVTHAHTLMHYFMLLYEEMHAYCSYSWNLSMAIPIIEIEVNVDMESDKKLDKLETFLGRLNSKGEHN